MVLAVMLAIFGGVVCLITQRWWGGGLEGSGLGRGRPLLIALVVVAIASCWVSVIERSGHTWNSVRTVLPVAMGKGIAIYHTHGEGPMWCSIYPPVGLALYTPTALASTPGGAIAVGQWLSVLFMAGSASVLGWRAGQAGGLAVGGAIIGGGIMIAGAAALDPLCDASFMVHVDAPAIGLGLLACGVLMLPGDARVPWRVALAGVLAGLAVMSKQTMLPLSLILGVWLWASVSERRWLAVGRFVLTWAATIASVAVATCAAYGWQAVLYSIVQLPSKHPLQLDAFTFRELAAGVLKWMLAPALLAATAAVLSKRDAGGRWTQSPTTLLVLAGLGEIPLALLAFLKIGGAKNNFAYVLAFLIAAIAIATIRFLKPTTPRSARIFAISTLVFSIAACVWNLLTIHTSVGWTNPNQHDLAYRVIQRSPGQYYFYWLPLSHLLAEGQQTHQSWGIMDHHLAGQSPSPEWLWRYVPRDALFICATDRPIPNDAGFAAMRQQFPQAVTLPELPGWYCFVRVTAASEKKQ